MATNTFGETSLKRPMDVEEIEPQTQKKPRTLFLRTDVTLEVEGRQLHVNRQRLADHSPVFKTMFESEFKEKHMDTITLPRKKYEEFETFLSSFCHPEFQNEITDETVLVILPLATEYQVTAVRDRCESFLTTKMERAIKDQINSIDIDTLLTYFECAERYNLSSMATLTVHLFARYDVELLKQAGVKELVKETWTEILEERNTLMTDVMTKIAKNGYTADVASTLNLFSGMEKGERPNTIMRDFECKLLRVCKDYKNSGLTMEKLVDIIIAGERFELDVLLQSAIALTSQCKTEKLKKTSRYHEISNGTKIKIDQARVQWMEEMCYRSTSDVNLP